MPNHASMVSSSSARIEALKVKHHKLEIQLHSEQQHYLLNDQEIRNLKLEKLRLKEEIEGIRRAS